MHCKQWLDKSGLWDRLLIFHVANERRGGFGTHMHFKRMGVRPGVADWLLFVPGRAIAIELKDDEGEQDADQIKFQRQWEAAGGLYFVRRTLEEFQGTVLVFARTYD
jgi:elongation factor P hydroxylase